MSTETISGGYHQVLQALSSRAEEAAIAWWRSLDPADMGGSWPQAAPGLLAALSVCQLAAAALAQPYVEGVVREQGAEPEPAGAVDPQALAGVASDGRPLETLLRQPVVATIIRSSAGMGQAESFALGLSQITQIAATQVSDAGRAAVGVAQAADRAVAGYHRRLSPPSCSRCAILAGRFYRWNAGFDRHPRCDCVHVPAAAAAGEQNPLGYSARGYFDSLSRADQDRIFTQAGAQAIRDGADPGQVVNARRGIHIAGERQMTTEGASRGFGARPMPEQICKDAADRAEAIELLRRHGYIL
jgi:hypothetical protein